MKKILALLLALVMVFALAACGQQAAPAEKPAEEPAAPAEEPAAETPVEEAPAEEPAEAPAEEAPVEVMSYADFMAAEVDDPVVIEAYVQAKQAYASDWSNTSVYLADQDGAYFAYRLACTQEEYDALVPGAKIRVTGFKAEWAGEIEIAEGCTFELIDGADTYLVDPVDVTELLGTDALAEHMNQLVTIKGVTVAESEGGVAFLYNWDGSGEDGNGVRKQGLPGVYLHGGVRSVPRRQRSVRDGEGPECGRHHRPGGLPVLVRGTQPPHHCGHPRGLIPSLTAKRALTKVRALFALVSSA